jgi:hypothetical protein
MPSVVQLSIVLCGWISQTTLHLCVQLKSLSTFGHVSVCGIKLDHSTQRRFHDHSLSEVIKKRAPDRCIRSPPVLCELYEYR